VVIRFLFFGKLILDEIGENMENVACDRATVGRPPKEDLIQMEEVTNKLQPTTDSLARLIIEYLSELPQTILILVASGMMLLVGTLNHIVGLQLFSNIFYLIPIVLVTWFAERWLGFIFSILSALTWLIADLSSGTTYFGSDIFYWNGVGRLGSFFILTVILSALKNILTQEKASSRIDFLTGVQNRRSFIELLSMEINRARRYEHPFTLVCLDLDNFKTVNDCFGHKTGDMILRSVARSVQENIRSTDTVARLGGDEFAILMPETGRNVAETIMGRVRNINLNIMRRHGWPVTLSIGVVTFKRSPSTVDETLQVSDQLMYNAKNNGKNSIRYEVFGAREWPKVTEA
jgi:diguanylate cyclase (GGDEF)-like protein